MTLPVSEEDREIIRAFVQLIERRSCCPACEHFDLKVERCQHPDAKGMRPPAKIIAYGCPSFCAEPPF